MNLKPTIYRYSVRTYVSEPDILTHLPRYVTLCRDRSDMIHTVRRDSKRDGFHYLIVNDLMPEEGK